MTVVPFKRPESRDQAPPQAKRRGLGEFVVAMAVVGLVIFLIPTLWSGVPQHLLAVIHLLVAVVYFQQGPRIAAAIWIALTLALLVLAGAPSPVSYALARGAAALDAALVR
jgi:ABC-type multidrug transport system permease subunit